jgi:hypothetical protein
VLLENQHFRGALFLLVRMTTRMGMVVAVVVRVAVIMVVHVAVIIVVRVAVIMVVRVNMVQRCGLARLQVGEPWQGVIGTAARGTH